MLVSIQFSPFGSGLILGRKKLSEDVNVSEEGDAEILLDSVSGLYPALSSKTTLVIIDFLHHRDKCTS